MFNNLVELIKSMPDEKACREYIAQQRWEGGKPVCPHCGHNKCYVIEGGKKYKCASPACYKKFSVTVGTVMEASNIPLVKWLTAIYLVTAHKKGISSYQLGRDLGIAQKNSWFMLMRIREMLKDKEATILGMDKPVEADETYIGGSISNKHLSKRKLYAENPVLHNNKTVVLGMIEREGKFVAKVINSGQPYEIVSTVATNLKNDATIMTDTSNIYNRLKSSYTHHAVNHSANEYVRGEVHTNSIEGAFSHFKRMVYGIYHQISPKHSQRYCDEFAHRYNTRKIKDAHRFTLSFQGLEGRLTYKNLIASPELTTVEKEAARSNRNGIMQIKDGELIAHYPTSKKAAQATGIQRSGIERVCRGERKSAGGFVWIFA